MDSKQPSDENSLLCNGEIIHLSAVSEFEKCIHVASEFLTLWRYKPMTLFLSGFFFLNGFQ